MKKTLLLLIILLSMTYILPAQSIIEEVLGIYQAISVEDSRLNEDFLCVKRCPNDKKKIIICDSSLFRNDKIEGVMELFEIDNRLIVKSEEFNGTADYDIYSGILIIDLIAKNDSEAKITSTWRKIDQVYLSDEENAVFVDNEKDIKVFPNPAKERINIDVPENLDAEGLKITVFNASGQMMRIVLAAGSKSIDVSDLKNGIYFIIMENRLFSETRKIAIVR